jgi:hypothetical protein
MLDYFFLLHVMVIYEYVPGNYQGVNKEKIARHFLFFFDDFFQIIVVHWEMSTVLKVDPAVMAKPVPADYVQFMPFRDRADVLHARPHFC